MSYSFTEKKRIRKSFAKQQSVLNVPYLLMMQEESYEEFLQQNTHPKSRINGGLQKAFNDIFPVVSNNGSVRLDFIEYSLQPSVFDVRECLLRGVSYASKLHAKVRLTVFDRENDNKSILYSTEENVYMGEIPLMTDTGSFIINGNERVVVSQLHRSPGVYFEHDGGKSHSSNKLLYSSKIVPYRGSWLDLEFDAKDLIYFRIDKRRKMNVTLLLKAIGYTHDDILNLFYDKDSFFIENGNIYKHITPSRLKGEIAKFDIKDKDGNIVVAKDKKITLKHVNEIENKKITKLVVPFDDLIGRVLACDIVDTDTGEVLSRSNNVIDEELVKSMLKGSIEKIETLYINDLEHGSYISDTLRDEENSKETAQNTVEAIHQIYKMMRPGEPYSEEIANNVFVRTFFSPETYDLSSVGRFKFNSRTYLNDFDNKSPSWFRSLLSSFKTMESNLLTKEDICIALAVLVELRNGRGGVDDIDHLGNRRIRSVGELVENQFRTGLSRIEKAVKDKLSQPLEEKDLLPNKLISAKPITSSLRDFFGLSQLSQFMDHTNPLSELTHKRRISALGPGGLARDRAGFEVRDVHVTHYGRVCPIETPEGQNIGLINSLSVYARPNKFGFLETPYRKVVNGVVTSEIDYLSAIDESKFVIAQANAKLNKDNTFSESFTTARVKGETQTVLSSSVNYMDVATNQVVSVAASLVPFLEHNDANRALMGSNMQRQGVPCVRSSKPLVGTGMERAVAIDSGTVVVAKRDGVVNYVDSSRIIITAHEIKSRDVGVDIYNLTKYIRSNQNTCLNQRPIVKVGDEVKSGDVIADGAATDLGELSVGQNVLVAFMPWNGYNFEDSILISEQLVSSDKYTSIHIEELVISARETKQGDEEVTSDIPNLSQSQLARLDESGIIHIGATVNAGDVLVGKVTPKGEIQLTPEEKLLRAIFGEKASDVKDTSLRVPIGMEGTVIDVQVFNRDTSKLDARSVAIIEQELAYIKRDLNDQRAIIEQDVFARLEKILLNQELDIKGKNNIIDSKMLDSYKSKDDWFKFKLKNDDIQAQLDSIAQAVSEKRLDLENRYKNAKTKLYQGVTLPNGVIKTVKVFIAVKRRLQPGDKMAGRHGNKGVVSRVLPVEDMPYMANGMPVDIVLNPIGVPSRMNIGQILEVHLGLASKGLGNKIDTMLKQERNMKEVREFLDKIYNLSGGKTETLDSLNDSEVRELASNLSHGVPFATPVFDGVSEAQIKNMLELADLPKSGQMVLYDGRTGNPFDRPITVGYMYMLRLHHLVDEKVHARSTGPYSLVTQQPLGGKAQFGGQRFGEMEVWALEAYGAAYILQEMLTVKSDDIEGRTKMYENLLEGRHNIIADVPEAFRVLTKEVRALGLDMELED